MLANLAEVATMCEFRAVRDFLIALRIRGPSLEGIEPSITRVCTLKSIVFEGADP